MTSFTSRVFFAGLRLGGVKKRLFDPDRFAGPSARTRKPEAPRPPRSVSRRSSVVRSAFEGWPVYTLTPRTGGAGGHLLYLHGGAFAEELSRFRWTFIARLADAAHRTATVVVHPLVPEHVHRDVAPTLHRLYAQVSAEHDGSPLALLGDSAGATLALTLVESTQPANSRPDDLLLLSPGLDATLRNPGSAAVADHDPLYGPLTDLGRVSVFTGTRDVLNPDAHQLVSMATGLAGTDVVLYEYPGMVHDWMMLPIPEARQALAGMAHILRTPRTGAHRPILAGSGATRAW